MKEALIFVWLLGLVAGITALFLANRALRGKKMKAGS